MHSLFCSFTLNYYYIFQIRIFKKQSCGLLIFFVILLLGSNIPIYSRVGRHDKADAVGAALLPLGWGLLCQL